VIVISKRKCDCPFKL